MKVLGACLLAAAALSACRTTEDAGVSEPKEGVWAMPKDFKPGFGAATAWKCVSEKTAEVYTITELNRKKGEAKLNIKGEDRDLTTPLYVYADGYMGWGDDKFKQPVNSVLIQASKTDANIASAFVQEDYGEKFEELLACKVLPAQ